MAYRKGIVYFIDILGSRERNSSKDNFDKSFFIADTFLTEMESVQNRHRETSLLDRAVFSFSDCAYIIYSLKEKTEKSDENKMRMIYQSLYNTQQVICNFVYNGFLCRGGIAYGDVYFDLGRNMVFGPAVNEAYSIESEKSIYPCITLENSLAEEIDSYSKNIKKKNPMATLDGNILNLNEKTNMYFFNYLNYFYRIGCVQLGKIFVTFEDFYEKALSFCNEQINLNSGGSQSEVKILEKQMWHRNYLMEMKNVIKNDDFSESDLLNLFPNGNNW